MSGEIWLGLESLYQLTSEGNYSLHINLTDFDQKTYVAVYDQFQVVMMMMTMIIMLIQVGPGDGYMLTVRGFNDALSTLGDSMYYSNGAKFSAK